MPQPSPQAPIHEDNLKEDREVWYLTLPSDEAEIAAEWLAINDPKALSEDRMSDMLHLQRLSPRSSVVLLLRKPLNARARLTPTQGYELSTATGERLTVRRNPADLIGEMQAYGPLMVDKYWEQGLTRFSSQLRRAAFLEELGKLAGGGATIGFADVASKRNGELPDLLQLRHC